MRPDRRRLPLGFWLLIPFALLEVLFFPLLVIYLIFVGLS